MSEDSALDRAKAEVDEMIGGRTLEERTMAADAEPLKTELWTPPERLSANVGKMAWALFLKWWDKSLDNMQWRELQPSAPEAYRTCILVAKELEEINQDPSKKDD